MLSMQMGKAAEQLAQAAPDKLLMLGGGCDADLPAITYLNSRYEGNLAILWLDAHGDLNAPVPAEGGLKASELLAILRSPLGNVVGMGIYEYAPAGRVVPLMKEILEIGIEL
ncbi:Arginase/agmatinase/formimionoglutamate hydrolase, arginase family [Slackia heliotrinireducens]|nr:Arginase/agmatinase/formimionoglutamate hydrolase, arginase family [Slackia heliotrinireducens]